MTASTGSPSTAITVAELSESLLPAIQDPHLNPRTSKLTITDRRNLANDVATLVVSMNGTEVDGLSIIETMDQFPDLARKTLYQQLLALGLSPLEIHHLISFASALKIKVMIAYEWVKDFEVTLSDSDEVEEFTSQNLELIDALRSGVIGTDMVSKGMGSVAGEQKRRNPHEVADPSQAVDVMGMLQDARAIGVELNKRTLTELIEHFGGKL